MQNLFSQIIVIKLNINDFCYVSNSKSYIFPCYVIAVPPLRILANSVGSIEKCRMLQYGREVCSDCHLKANMRPGDLPRVGAQ